MLSVGQEVETISLKPQPDELQLTTCPCCATQVKVVKPLIDINTNTVSWQGATRTLEPQQVDILHTIVDAYPDIATHEKLIRALWAAEAQPLNAKNVIYLRTGQLRRLLQGMGLRIENTNKRGFRLVIEAA